MTVASSMDYIQQVLYASVSGSTSSHSIGYPYHLPRFWDCDILLSSTTAYEGRIDRRLRIGAVKIPLVGLSPEASIDVQFSLWSGSLFAPSYDQTRCGASIT